MKKSYDYFISQDYHLVRENVFSLTLILIDKFDKVIDFDLNIIELLIHNDKEVD